MIVLIQARGGGGGNNISANEILLLVRFCVHNDGPDLDLVCPHWLIIILGISTYECVLGFLLYSVAFCTAV